MCGIVAVSSSQAESFSLSPVLHSISHRGPDDNGHWASTAQDCHLGHVRLSIVDLSSNGHQPMTDASGRFVMVYNGEVYNFQALKSALETAHGTISWRSHSDSELIVEGFAREGADFLSKLNGIFALAIYDSYEQRLLVLRDPMGIKPLYFTAQNGSVYFCSEVKGLLAFPNIQRTIRKQSLADVLTFMYVPEPYTMYNEIHKVEPGQYICFERGIQVASGWLFNHLTEPMDLGTDDEMIEQFQEVFSKSVQRQLMGDVPVSLFLSGGLDSSAVAYETVTHGADVKDAYTIAFNSEDAKYDGQSDDLHYAKVISDKLDIKLNVIEAKQNLLEMLPELSPYMEDGLADPACINTYIIAKAARDNGVKVMLSGQGADEFLGGYRRYMAEKMYRTLPNLLLKGLAVGGKLIPNSVPGRFNDKVRRLKKLTNTAALPEAERLLSLYLWNTPKVMAGLFQDSSDISIGQSHIDLFSQHQNLDIVDAMMKVDQKYDLMSLNLAYTDKMGMMAGLEARVPFLDFELIKLMNSVPVGMKLRSGTQKYILKKAMEPYLPHEVIYRQKAGFALPIRAWLKAPSELTKHYLDSERIRRQGIFNPQALASICQEQFSGQRDHTYMLFAMLSLQIWLDANDISVK